jgi:NADP-dependent 3-hydroxy acid dehydrogenase YdfG
MNTRLEGKVAFISGGSRGIGAAIAQRLAGEGAQVVIGYAASSTAALALVDRIETGGGKAVAVQADAADPAALTRAIDDAAARFGRLDILVNNAGVLLLGPVDTFSLEDFDRTLAVNVRAVFVAAKAAAAHMGDGGRIVNISSTNALRMPFTGGAAYAMSKSALTGLAKGLARGRALLRLVAAAIIHAAHAGVAAHALATAQHLHVLGDDVGRVALDAVLVGVLAGLQAAFDVDRRAFFKVLAHDLGQAAEERDAVPFGQLFLFAGLAVLRLVRGGDRDVRDGVAARHVADFRIAAEVADDDDLVN